MVSKAKTSGKAKPTRAAKPARATKAARTAKSARAAKPPRTAKPPRAATPAGDAESWRADTLERMRALILQADPRMIEERKWRKPSNAMLGVPVWSHDGIVCTGETYKDKVKLTFANGASILDPSRLFNSSLEGNARRAIDIHEGEEVDADAFKALVTAAVALNAKKGKP